VDAGTPPKAEALFPLGKKRGGEVMGKKEAWRERRGGGLGKKQTQAFITSRVKSAKPLSRKSGQNVYEPKGARDKNQGGGATGAG